MTDPNVVATVFVGMLLSLAGGIWVTQAINASDQTGVFIAVFIWIVGVAFLVSGGTMI